MKVWYKCRCMDSEREIEVPAREKDTPLLFWMADLQGLIGDDHSVASPYCRRTKLEYAKIPVADEEAGIGVQPKLH